MFKNKIMDTNKIDVKIFWEEASCGEDLYLKGFNLDDYKQHAYARYILEPIILDIINEVDLNRKNCLEIGVGLGADHSELAKKGSILSGIDLTERAINHTKKRLELMGLKSDLKIGDAENLPFKENLFDFIYSWGVIHHSPNTPKAVDEIYRILKPGGKARIMIYNKYSLIGFMLWLRFGLPSFKSLNFVYDKYLESPGTKAYSYKEAKILFSSFVIEKIYSPLTHGDLLDSEVGQRHRGFLLSFIKKIWPRRVFKILLPNNGLFLILHLTKPY